MFSQTPPSIENSQDSETNVGIYVDENLLNPADSVEFTKYGYLSPSLINFAGANTHNLLVDGRINTDVSANKNALLNIIRQNFNNTQEIMIFQLALLAQGQEKIVPIVLLNQIQIMK